MNKTGLKKYYGLLSVVMLTLLSSNGLFAKELEEVTTQLVLTGGEHISGKHFKCDGEKPYIAVVVAGDNITIEKSLFTGCYAGIIVAGAKNTTIKGNRFEDVGVAIREKDNGDRGRTKGTTVIFNEFRGVGVKNCLDAPEWLFGEGHNYWACDAFVANAKSSFGKFNNNLIDNRGKVTKYIEDFVNIGDGSSHYEVKNNIVIGSSELHSSSDTGACVVIDTDGENFDISGNQCYDSATSGYANAGGDNVSIENNLIYISKQHALLTWNHPAHKERFVGDTTGISSSSYKSRPCGKNTKVINNSSYVYYVYYDKEGELRDTQQTHNWEDGFGECTDFSYLEGNHFYSYDPQWEIPDNLFDNLSKEYFSGQSSTINGEELIEGGGNSREALYSSKWSFFGQTYGQQSRDYGGEKFIYSTPKDEGSGLYQAFQTEIGKSYEVSAILIGSDTNREEQFNGYSYLTISSAKPTQNESSVLAQSDNISGGVESFVSFRFVAETTTSYLALRSDRAWHYASARSLSVKRLERADTPPIELIRGGGNTVEELNKSQWSFFGQTYGQQSRDYRGEKFIYSTPKDVGSGMYQGFQTEPGKRYEVSAILIGSDTNREEQFNGYSYLTISSAIPVQSKNFTFAESKQIKGGEERRVTFTFIAKSRTTYLALRSDAKWHYASARAISVKRK